MNVKLLAPEGFSERFRNVVLSSGKEITQIAKNTGIARSSIYGYMWYDIPPNSSNLYRLCLYLRCSADYLLFGKGGKKHEQAAAKENAEGSKTETGVLG